MMLRTLVLHLFLLSQMKQASSYVLECTVSGKTIKVTEEVPVRIVSSCKNATYIVLKYPDVFSPIGMTDEAANTILQISHVDMCLNFSRTRHELLKFHMKKLTGKCKGPLLEVTMNEALKNVEAGEFLSDLRTKPSSIRIRGNPKLADEFLEQFKGFDDVQREGVLKRLAESWRLAL
ncbi:hypothetical protein Y032_0113g405 [Ancylostoma ceylanicum]|uniref:Receptor L-domain domain-containing protein n=1 Tax=Ancylostoma ceylanicum TaxID=53326 RepID=A0A016TDQ8_9BILA|nr:hypothetical protein Y032_0113g405 [Ancylostoma ceylanicum]